MSKKFWRFYKSDKPGIVWDHDNNCLLVTFKNGQVITDDPRIAKILNKMGYPQVGLKDKDPPDIPNREPIPDDFNASINNKTEQMELDKLEAERIRKMALLEEERDRVKIVTNQSSVTRSDLDKIRKTRKIKRRAK